MKIYIVVPQMKRGNRRMLTVPSCHVQQLRFVLYCILWVRVWQDYKRSCTG